MTGNFMIQSCNGCDRVEIELDPVMGYCKDCQLDSLIESVASTEDEAVKACVLAIRGLKQTKAALLVGKPAFDKTNEAAGKAIEKFIAELDLNIRFFGEIIEILNRSNTQAMYNRIKNMKPVGL